MASLLHSPVTVVLVLLSTVIVVHSQLFKENQKNQEMCNKLGQDPYFETEMVVGKSWRVYYSWNLPPEIAFICGDLVFKIATPQTVQRIWGQMNKYLDQQPAWDAEALLLVIQHDWGNPMVNKPHEMLLLADQSVPGRFRVVPIFKEIPKIISTQLLKFQFKLFHKGKYLVMMDCNAGISSMSTQPTKLLNRSEILATAAPLDLGNGFPACMVEKNEKEIFHDK